MKSIILILLISIIGFPALSQSEGIDTLVYRNSNKRGVYVIKHDQSTVEYKTSVEAKEISIISFYKLDFLILRNGDTIKTNSREAYIDDYYVFKKGMDNINKRKGHLLLGSHLANLYRVSPYNNSVATLGFSYYFNSFISIGAFGYLGLKSNSGSKLQNGYEMNLGLSSSKNRNIDIGIRTGFITQNFSYTEQHNNAIYVYNETAGGSTMYNGKEYAYSSTITEQGTLRKINAARTNLFLKVELMTNITDKLSLTASAGYRSRPSSYILNNYNGSVTTIRRYYNSSGGLDGEEIQYGHYENPTIWNERMLFVGVTINYHFILKKQKNN